MYRQEPEGQGEGLDSAMRIIMEDMNLLDKFEDEKREMQARMAEEREEMHRMEEQMEREMLLMDEQIAQERERIKSIKTPRFKG